MEVRPITPEDAFRALGTSIPAEAVSAWNDLIVKKFNGESAVILQKEAVAALRAATSFTSEEIFERRLLDIEGLFESYGWRVIYDKPAYNETYEAKFTFEKKK